MRPIVVVTSWSILNFHLDFLSILCLVGQLYILTPIDIGWDFLVDLADTCRRFKVPWQTQFSNQSLQIELNFVLLLTISLIMYLFSLPTYGSCFLLKEKGSRKLFVARVGALITVTLTTIFFFFLFLFFVFWILRFVRGHLHQQKIKTIVGF